MSAAMVLASLGIDHQQLNNLDQGTALSSVPEITPFQTCLVPAPSVQAPGPALHIVKETKHKRRNPLKDEVINFPKKLFDILQKPEHQDVLMWLSGGKAFIILDKERFVSDIIPIYFKACQFPSFARKLKRWKFVRVPKGPYAGAFYHKLFRRSSKCLCELMSCDDNVPQDIASLFSKVRTWKEASICNR